MRTWLSALALLAGLVLAVLVPGASATRAVAPPLPGGFPAPLLKPTPAASTGQLMDVSVVSTSFAVTVGIDWSGDESQALIEMWNGHKWTIVPSNAPATSALTSVSCSSKAFCVAAGAAPTDAGGVDPLILTWNGKSWSVAEAATVPGKNSGLWDVSCSSSSFCAAVGYVYGTPEQTLVETWNGSTWSLETSANQTPGGTSTRNVLQGVSCPSDGSCIAVGDYDSDPSPGSYDVHRTLALTRNTETASWEIMTTVDPPDPDPLSTADASFHGVSCLSDGSCTAVGSVYASDTGTRALIETWDGTEWQVEAAPDTTGTTNGDTLVGVSCPKSDLCVAVGASGMSDSNYSATLVETWDGSDWTVTSSPNFTITEKKTGNITSFDNFLWGVSSLSTGSFTSVGYYMELNQDLHPLIVSWNGHNWTTTG